MSLMSFMRCRQFCKIARLSLKNRNSYSFSLITSSFNTNTIGTSITDEAITQKTVGSRLFSTQERIIHDFDDIPSQIDDLSFSKCSTSKKPTTTIDNWWTGKRPIYGECPGMSPSGILYSLPQLSLNNCTKKGIQDYFDNTWTMTEALFECLKNEEAFKIPPVHNLRHPMIFYYGHPAALYVNKLRVAGLLQQPINPYFEIIFETGVDEMSWDDLSKNEMNWPTVAEVHTYRQQVYATVSSLIQSLNPTDCLHIHRSHSLWSLVMAFEHERIHIETSSVLIAEMGLQYLQHPTYLPPYHPSSTSTSANFNPIINKDFPENNMIAVPESTISLGKPDTVSSFGWDNEYGTRTFHVPAFEASQYKITNGEFLAFVKDGGYADLKYWTEEGWGWRTFRNAKWPSFWRSVGPQGLHHYTLRVLFDEISMPWDWPVVVNLHEAKAFAEWKNQNISTSSSSGQQQQHQAKKYRLSTELEHHALREGEGEGGGRENTTMPNTTNTAQKNKIDPVYHCTTGILADEMGINSNLSYSSMSPVTAFPPNEKGFYDLYGNAWEWCLDKFSALHGFNVHPYYEDFSTPCFDGLHHVIIGSSFISTGNEASAYSRYHFRPHFFQHAGFRLVLQEPNLLVTSDTDAPGPFVGTTYPFRRTLAASAQAEKDMVHQKNMSMVAKYFGSVDNTVVFTGKDHSPVSTTLINLITRYSHQCALPLQYCQLLEIGCGPGGIISSPPLVAPLTLRSYTGVDHRKDLIEIANKNKYNNNNNMLAATATATATSSTSTHTNNMTPHLSPLSNNITFITSDPMCLPAAMRDYNIVLLNDVIDTLSSPNALLSRLGGLRGLVAPGGLLIVTSGFQWREECTPKGLWIGGYLDATTGLEVQGADILIDRLSTDFDVVNVSVLPVLWKESSRDFRAKVYDVIIMKRKGDSKN